MLTLWRPRRICALLLFPSLWMLRSPASAQEIITLPTRANVTQSYFLTSAPKQLQAVAILFPGSGGLLRLRMTRGRLPKRGKSRKSQTWAMTTGGSRNQRSLGMTSTCSLGKWRCQRSSCGW